jgi:ABC-type lipoprotein release transport system permease subunit
VELARVRGIDLTTFSDALEFFHMSPVIHPALTTETELRMLATTLVTALLAGIYPAVKAARLDAADTLRRP